MTILLNGKPHEVAGDVTLATLVLDRAGSTRGCAVVLDGEVVPRSEWDVTVLADGADVELITAVPGG